MANLRDSYQAAADDDYSDSDSDYGAVYGANIAGYDSTDPEISSGWTFEGAPETPAASPETKVNLGPAYHYENGQKVYDEGDYAPGPHYYTPEGGRAGINWGQGNATPPPGGSAVGDLSWATPYNKAAAKVGGVSASGIKSGITTSQKPYATVQTSKTVYPTGTQYPTFKGPTWDDKEIKKRTQKAAAPGLRSLEMKVAQAMSRYYENPNVRRMVLRDTLAGYGIGIANIRAQAGQQARAEYGQEYARMYTEALGDYNRQIAKLGTQATQVSTTKQVATQSEYEKIAGEQEKLSTLA